MIELKAVGKNFRVAPGPGRKAGVVVALRNITTSLETGTIIGVVGPNGAGKTTLFGLLLGFLEATDGDIAIDGAAPRDYVRRHGASYLPERFQLPRDWTVRSALHALLSLEASPRPVDDILAEYELTQYATAAAHTLSRGTMQRLGVAQALAAPRNLVVLDEPTEGLDPLWRVRFRESVQQLRADGRTVLIASHDLVEIERLADRVIVLKGGTIADDISLSSERSDPREYSMVLSAASERFGEYFPRHRVTGHASYAVTVDDAVDLTARLRALLESGAIVVSVTPDADLEQRITAERG